MMKNIKSTKNSIDCWFCHEKFPLTIMKKKTGGFTCPNCEQYNGFSSTSKSGYDKFIPELLDEDLNVEENDVVVSEGNYNLDDVFYNDVQFCDKCIRSQENNCKSQEFKTCEDCRERVKERLKKIQKQTDQMYKKELTPKRYSTKQKLLSLSLTYSSIFLIPLEILYAFFMYYENEYYHSYRVKKFLSISICLCSLPLLYQGFLFPFIIFILTYIFIDGSKNPTSFVSFYFGNTSFNPEIFGIISCFLITGLKIVTDEIKRVRMCKKCETEKEKRDCYLYQNLFNEEDNLESPFVKIQQVEKKRKLRYKRKWKDGKLMRKVRKMVILSSFCCFVFYLIISFTFSKVQNFIDFYIELLDNNF